MPVFQNLVLVHNVLLEHTEVEVFVLLAQQIRLAHLMDQVVAICVLQEARVLSEHFIVIHVAHDHIVKKGVRVHFVLKVVTQ